MHLRLLTITSLIAGIGLAVSAIAQPAVPTKEMVVTPFEQVKFVPIDPTKPNGNQIAVAEGDPDRRLCALCRMVRQTRSSACYA